MILLPKHPGVNILIYFLLIFLSLYRFGLAFTFDTRHVVPPVLNCTCSRTLTVTSQASVASLPVKSLECVPDLFGHSPILGHA